MTMRNSDRKQFLTILSIRYQFTILDAILTVLKTNSMVFFPFSDDCCIARNGSIDWSTWCNLYYEIRPPSRCDGYEPPSQGKLFNTESFKISSLSFKLILAVIHIYKHLTILITVVMYSVHLYMLKPRVKLMQQQMITPIQVLYT